MPRRPRGFPLSLREGDDTLAAGRPLLGVSGLGRASFGAVQTKKIPAQFAVEGIFYCYEFQSLLRLICNDFNIKTYLFLYLSSANSYPFCCTQMGDTSGLPSRWQRILAMKRSTEFCTASGDQPPTWGVSTTASRSISSCGGSGSLS